MNGLAYLKLKIKAHGREAVEARLDEMRNRRIARDQFKFAVEHEDNTKRSLAADRAARAQLTADNFYVHRKRHLRSEVRSCLLVYGFLRGKNYREIEDKTKSYPDWGNGVHATADNPNSEPDHGRMIELVGHFCDPNDKQNALQRFAEWRDAAYADLRAEFQARAKQPRKQKLRARRVVDQLVRSEAKARGMPMRTVLERAGISPNEWADIVRGQTPFGEEHASCLCAALEMPPAMFLAIEQSYQRFVAPPAPPIAESPPA